MPGGTVIDLDGLEALIATLRADGFRVVGPTVRDGAIVHGEISAVADLPAGWRDVQEPGRYRLERRADSALFGHAVGPHSWKSELFRAREPLVTLHAGGWVEPAPDPDEQVAFLGVRPCELRAIGIQDRVFLGGPVQDRPYAARRRNALLVAVECGAPASTCFCTSMSEGGPSALPGEGYDLVLTELAGDAAAGGPHRFLARAGSSAGESLLARVPSAPAAPADEDAARAVTGAAAQAMTRAIPDAASLPDLLRSTLDHPRWDDVAARCLNCASCTLACPTCFCSSVEDVSDLSGESATRTRVWDTCFSVEHSYIHGGAIRPSGRSRYRQWLTHKLGTWHDQFDTSGCTGCGRCIAWCPVGIDITAEVAALRTQEGDQP